MAPSDRTQPSPLDRLEGALHRHPWWPHLTLPRVGEALEHFLAYQDRHRPFLVTHGLPPELIPDAPWLSRRLACQYDTRATRSSLPRAAAAGRPTPYEWVRLQDGQWLTVTDPSEASLLGGLTEADAQRLERERGAFHRYKRAMLRLIRDACTANASSRPEADSLLGDCVDLTDSELGVDGVRFYLGVDRARLGRDCGGGYRHGPTPHHPGGLTDLFDLVGEVLVERTERWSDRLFASVPWRLWGVIAARSEAVLRRPGTALCVVSTDPAGTEESLTSKEDLAVDVALALAAEGERQRYEWAVPYVNQLGRRLSDRLGCEVADLFPDRHADRRWELLEEYGRILVDRANASAPLEVPFTPRPRPVWDARARTLWFRGVAAAYRAYGGDDSGTILAAFEAAGWPEVIDLPPPLAGRRSEGKWLSEKVRSLNTALPPGMGMQFFNRAGQLGWSLSAGG